MSAARRSGRRIVVFLAGLLGAMMLAACGSAGAKTSTALTHSTAATTATRTTSSHASTASTTPASSSSAASSVAVPRGRTSSGPSGTQTVTITSQGRSRTFLVDAPSGSGVHPLVLVYHGAEDTAANTIGETDFSTLATEKGWIIVYPQGYDDTWNEGAGDTPAHAAGVNDVFFTQQILRYMEAHYSIDRRRIAAVGESNGALLAELLGCRIASQLTLIVPVEGQLPVSVSPGCAPARPISVFEIHGTADASIPYGGGHFNGVGGGTTVLSAPASARRWATLDRCRTGSPSAQTSGSSTLTTYSGCDSGASVVLDTIHGGVHEWTPGIALLVGGQFAHPAKRPAATP